MITLKNEAYTATIAELGAEIQQIENNDTGRKYLIDDPQGKYWNRHAPILFPAIGKSNDDTYLLDGKAYPMGQHGFARDFKFDEVNQQDDTHVTLTLHANAETLTKFPFNFALRVSYVLTNTGLTTDFEVVNHDDKPFPYALGSHPAFQLNAPLEDYRLTLEGVSSPLTKFGVGPVPFRDGSVQKLSATNVVPLSHKLLDDGLVIINAPEATAAVLQDKDGSHTVKVSLDDFPYVCIWSPEHKTAPFMCVEPFAGLPDQAGKPGEWTKKAGNNILAANSSQSYSYTMTLD